MPELPEVERGRTIAESVSAGRVITRARCARDEFVFDESSGATISRRLRGRRVEAVRRRGKHLWFELDARPWPIFHFGMTGAFRVPGGTPLTLQSSPTREDGAWPPRFTKIHLHFDDGGELVMVNKRRLGRIRLREDPEHEPPISRLGFDPLLDLPTPRAFVKLVQGRSAIMKGLLLDQAFAAGVGNWIADEILYQAKIDPRRRADSLSEAEAKRVRTALKRIIETAVRADSDKTRFPRSWLFHHRWGKNSEAVTTRGERIEHLTLAGRTTAWVPKVQA
ncbi:MAG: Fpg/Nei family DNA glycosylase [Planctomycetota bacterium]|jgi:formamidopyrimidine-DNA glycosylase